MYKLKKTLIVETIDPYFEIRYGDGNYNSSTVHLRSDCLHELNRFISDMKQYSNKYFKVETGKRVKDIMHTFSSSKQNINCKFILNEKKEKVEKVMTLSDEELEQVIIIETQKLKEDLSYTIDNLFNLNGSEHCSFTPSDMVDLILNGDTSAYKVLEKYYVVEIYNKIKYSESERHFYNDSNYLGDDFLYMSDKLCNNKNEMFSNLMETVNVDFMIKKLKTKVKNTKKAIKDLKKNKESLRTETIEQELFKYTVIDYDFEIIFYAADMRKYTVDMREMADVIKNF
jgi:hypothetical protein